MAVGGGHALIRVPANVSHGICAPPPALQVPSGLEMDHPAERFCRRARSPSQAG